MKRKKSIEVELYVGLFVLGLALLIGMMIINKLMRGAWLI